MGLDMFLNARRSIDRYSNSVPNELINCLKKTYPGIVNLDGDSDDHPFRAVSAEIAYWRKANAIHAWFVENVQDGKDDCGSYYVSFDKLEQLADVCGRVLADRSLAADLLPSQSGFFFGTTEYDEWYFDSLIYTVTRIKAIIENLRDEHWHIEYHSSW